MTEQERPCPRNDGVEREAIGSSKPPQLVRLPLVDQHVMFLVVARRRCISARGGPEGRRLPEARQLLAPERLGGQQILMAQPLDEQSVRFRPSQIEGPLLTACFVCREHFAEQQRLA